MSLTCIVFSLSPTTTTSGHPLRRPPRPPHPPNNNVQVRLRRFLFTELMVKYVKYCKLF